MPRGPSAARLLAAAPVVGLVAGVVAVLVAVLANGGCGLPDPRYHSEDPPESRAWTPVPGLPDWVASARSEDGVLRMVVESKSNDRFVAAAPGGAVRALTRRVERTLAPVVGAEDAARAAAAAGRDATLVRRVAKDEVLSRTADAGNTLSTVWTLCEVPFDAVLDPLPPDRREAARAALER